MATGTVRRLFANLRRPPPGARLFRPTHPPLLTTRPGGASNSCARRATRRRLPKVAGCEHPVVAGLADRNGPLVDEPDRAPTLAVGIVGSYRASPRGGFPLPLAGVRPRRWLAVRLSWSNGSLADRDSGSNRQSAAAKKPGGRSSGFTTSASPVRRRGFPPDVRIAHRRAGARPQNAPSRVGRQPPGATTSQARRPTLARSPDHRPLPTSVSAPLHRAEMRPRSCEQLPSGRSTDRLVPLSPSAGSRQRRRVLPLPRGCRKLFSSIRSGPSTEDWFAASFESRVWLSLRVARGFLWLDGR